MTVHRPTDVLSSMWVCNLHTNLIGFHQGPAQRTLHSERLFMKISSSWLSTFSCAEDATRSLLPLKKPHVDRPSCIGLQVQGGLPSVPGHALVKADMAKIYRSAAWTPKPLNWTLIAVWCNRKTASWCQLMFDMLHTHAGILFSLTKTMHPR